MSRRRAKNPSRTWRSALEEFGDPVIGEREAGVRFRRWDGRREDVSGKGARGFSTWRNLFDAIPNHESTGGQIAKALMVAGYEDGDGTDGVKERDLVDVADEVASHRLKQADRPARALNDTNAGDTLAGGTAVPEGFKEREIAPIEEEDQENIDGDRPLLRELIESAEAGHEVGEDFSDDQNARNPNEIVDQQCDEPASDAGNGHLDRYEFRRFNAKLV